MCVHYEPAWYLYQLEESLTLLELELWRAVNHCVLGLPLQVVLGVLIVTK